MESDSLEVKYGVPQGSTLGPLLYILYVYDCFENVNDANSNVIMYADDTVLMSIGANVYDAQCSSQKILDKYVLWSTTNGLKINVAKTKQMFFNSQNRNQQPLNNICITGGTVTNADTYVYLGVTMDRNLTFEPFLKDRHQWWRRDFRCSLSLSMDKLFPMAVK